MPSEFATIGDFYSARANHFILRHGEFHVVDAEVGEELRRVVILVAIPRAVPPNSHFRKPLAAEQEIAFPSRTSLGLGKFCLKGNLELNECARRDRFRDMQIDDGLIIFIAVVRSDVLQVLGDVPLVDDLNAFDVFGPVVLVFPLVVRQCRGCP